MAKIHPKRADFKAVFKEFDGLCDSAAFSSRAADMRNFRIRADGTLEKRGGYRSAGTFSAPLRGFFQGSLGQTVLCLAVCGSSVYTYDPDTHFLDRINTLTTSSGRVCFFLYRGNLYLADGRDLRYYDKTTSKFVSAQPYIPLYGKNWHPSTLGNVNEGFNLLTNQIRIQYLNLAGNTTFRLPYFAASITGLYLDGVRTQSYSFTANTNTFSASGAGSAVSVEVCFTANLVNQSGALRAARHGTVFTGKKRETLCLWGDVTGYRIFPSTEVDSVSLAGSRVWDGDSMPLYFRESDVLPIGDGEHPVNALVPEGERLLVFNSLGTWSVTFPDTSGGAPQILPLATGIGCASTGGTVSCGGKLYVAASDGIYRVDAASGSEDALTAVSISDTVSDFFPAASLQHTILRYDRLHNELWARNTADTSGLVMVYHLSRKQWYAFDDVHADEFFDFPIGSGFLAGGMIGIFDESLNTDSNREYTAYYQSGFFGLSEPETRKRSLRVTLCADTGNASPTLKVESESTQKTLTLTGSTADSPELLDTRLSLGGFRMLRFRITAAGQARCRFYSLVFRAND